MHDSLFLKWIGANHRCLLYRNLIQESLAF